MVAHKSYTYITAIATEVYTHTGVLVHAKRCLHVSLETLHMVGALMVIYTGGNAPLLHHRMDRWVAPPVKLDQLRVGR